MFKLESYITPIILSYVNRYIKNFKTEDSQVSLWGGDVTFNNLELNLEVLEEELQLPFSFVSGNIRELSIHVPWTKITSEPITVTINTIECILNLKGKTVRKRKKTKDKATGQGKQVEAPPGYIQSLINKIVSNICIYCNNLILKYVEEDIVLSMNVKLLKFESANEKWEPAYTDLSSAQVILRKVISISDLTLCLDKRNASGKIEVYQEPMLYRCSMTIYMLKHYHSSTANIASTTRLDIYCDNMEFSMTEQQVPMVMRLIMLIEALQQKQIKSEIEVVSDVAGPSIDVEIQEMESTWTGWAWSYVSSVLPDPWEDDSETNEVRNFRGHTLHFGLYVDRASITFKVSESNNDRSYYSHKKLRYHPMLTLDLQGIYSNTIIHGLQWFNCTAGVSKAVLLPVGYCSCGHLEGNESTLPYLNTGTESNFHKVDSLFDAEAVENKGEERQYDSSMDLHLSMNPESVLLEKTPAFAFDYVYQIDFTEDINSDILSDMGSNYEFSNFVETSALRLCVGPLQLRICSGLIHRFHTIQMASTFYDYPPYYTVKPDVSIQDLLPPSAEDFDALSEFIPGRSIRITLFNPLIELELMDHEFFEPTKSCLYKRNKKTSTTSMATSSSILPKLTLECEFIDISQRSPMYPNRLVNTTCQLPEPPRTLFDACFVQKSVKIVGLLSRLVSNPVCHSIMLTPSSISFSCKSILKSQYWLNSDIPHEEIVFESESITLNGTKAKMLVAYEIIERILSRDIAPPGKGLYSSSLLSDACKDFGLPYMEIGIEEVRFKKVLTNSTKAIDASVAVIKAFIFETQSGLTSENIQQVLFISGPEVGLNSSTDSSVQELLLTLTVQFPLKPDIQKHPPIFIFNLREIRICVDPLLCKWLLYNPKNFCSNLSETSSISKTRLADTPRRLSANKLESVHSNSDQKITAKTETVTNEELVDTQERVYNVLKTWFDVWKGLFLFGDISQCTIYFPMSSLSAVGSQGIQEAVELALVKDDPPDILIITLPFANIRSAQRHNANQYLKNLPVSMPESLWSADKSSFPWTLSISDMSCYTIQNGQKITFLMPVSLSVTVGLSTRPAKGTSKIMVKIPEEDVKRKSFSKKDRFPPEQSRKGSKNTNISAASSSNAQYGKSNSDSTPSSPQTQLSSISTKVDIGSLGVCIHIDTTPIVISTSEVQVYLFASILYGLIEVASNILPEKRKTNIKPPPEVSITKGSSTLSPSRVKESTFDNISDKTPPLNSALNEENLMENESVKLTAWIQWTITRFSIELFAKSVDKELKLVFDAEDIVSSIDFQSVYLKVKSKLGAASIQHFERTTPDSKWISGAFSGIVMRLRDDLTTQRQEDSSLVNVTITRASCQHTHTLWGAVQKKDIVPDAAQILSKSRYITEIVVNVQPLDFIISLDTLKTFYLVLVPLVAIPKAQEKKVDASTSSSVLASINNQTLPLAYFECQEIRIFMPSKQLLGNLHDTLLMQVPKISLSPQADNPIIRTPLRSDIYDRAAHARILNIPGSEVEDRQYQLDIVGISVCTGSWEEIATMLVPKSDLLSDLRGMSENPALEWNILEKGQPNVKPTPNLRCIIEKYDISIVGAPLMMYKDNIIVCGHSLEINLVSDISIHLSLEQIKLFSTLVSEFVVLITPLVIEDGIFKQPKIKFPYSSFESLDSINSSVLLMPSTNRDSGIETSDFRSHLTSDVSTSRPQGFSKNFLSNIVHISPPIEGVLISGKITFTLYSIDDERIGLSTRFKGRKSKKSRKADEDLGYEASEESTDDKFDYKKHIPLLYVAFTQPNVFFVNQQVGAKIQISCYDVVLKISGPEYGPVNRIPTEEDFPVSLIETRMGTPNPNNGILPAFFSLKFIKGIGKNSKIELDILKPTKILCQVSKWAHLLSVKDKLVDVFESGGGSGSFIGLTTAIKSMKTKEAMSVRLGRFEETFEKFQQIKDILGSVNSINIKCDQLIVAICSETGHELHLGVRELKTHLFLTNRPEKICLGVTLDCVTLTILYDNFKKLLLNPWTVSFSICVFWESWQDLDSDPQIQITGESDNILIDVTAEQLKYLQIVIKDINEFAVLLPASRKPPENHNEIKVADKDQHYKDDLRAGAFQFVDSITENADELPLPYQVMFWTKTISAMAWRYPQPRALTKVRVFPVPYKMTFTDKNNIAMLCHLEYWSECRNSYLPYTQFYLSESEICHLKLPDGNPKNIVASTWRVVITCIDEHTKEPLFSQETQVLGSTTMSPRALAACMRIDSYFSKRLIPDLNVALNISKLELALYNYFPHNFDLTLPSCLKNYTSDFAFTKNQKFFTLSFENLNAYFSTWNFEIFNSELTSSIKSRILDYGYLTEQTFIDPFEAKLDVSLSTGLHCHFISKPIRVKFGPSIAHTLAVSSQMWTQNDQSNFIVITRYVICNDTNVVIRFGQNETDENILIQSRMFHLYSWRSQKRKQQFKVSLEDSNWVWSKPFSVHKEGTQILHFNSETNFTIFVTIQNIANSQKQITFFGQLIVCNMLAEHFEMKVTEAVLDNKEHEFRNAINHVVRGKQTAPSIFINNGKTYFLRLRFYGLESAWTGDIPLREHTNGSQPWLVKVPLQERGHFLSIWCRIFVENFGRFQRTLAMLWPLFMIRSNLPMSIKVHIETPTLGVHLDSVVSGKGELQQLYCPGTIDHSHQISFKLDEGKNNSYVPLNYSLVDQREFFKRSIEEDTSKILDSLSSCFESNWPYFNNDLGAIEWIVDENQPLTHIQVRYLKACNYSAALVAELLPWCLMVNTLGAPISLMLNGTELCRVQHKGIIAPPRLEESFHLGVSAGNNWFFSGPLQLAKSSWSQSFYMPKITGNIPLEGTITTYIKCDLHLYNIHISSVIKNEIRLLSIASTHVLSNHVNMQFNVICLAVPDGNVLLDLPKNLKNHYFTIAPHSHKESGIPILQWYMLKDNESSNIEYVLYVAFSIDMDWSCPIRVDKPLARKGFSIQTKDASIPVVLTSQEVKGQIYMALHHDPRPQVMIENSTNVDFYCGQSVPEDNSIAKECEHFRWNFNITPKSRVYYNMPLVSEKFPELPPTYFYEKLSIGYKPTDKETIEWSPGISIINNNDLFVRVPYYGDLKLTIINTACTTLIKLDSVSEVEISARDIRVRLSMRQIAKSDQLYHSKDENAKLSEKPSIRQKLTRLDSDETKKLLSSTKDFLVDTIPLQIGWQSITANIFITSIGIVLYCDSEQDAEERWEIASFVADDVVIKAKQSEHQLKVYVIVSDLQLDNQLHTRQTFDFPVVLIGDTKRDVKKQNVFSIPLENLFENCEESALMLLDVIFESWRNPSGHSHNGIKTIKLVVNPLRVFVEDTYVYTLMQYMKDLNIVDMVVWPEQNNFNKFNSNSIAVYVPELVAWQCALLAQPLTMRCFVVDPISVLLSVHSSVKMYIALDQSPLQFGKFERKRLFTTSYRLGHALTMHYLSGAIFGAGWVVSSLELLGSPGGLARAMGSGLRDFVSLPYRGLLQGPMAFLRGVTTGSASLMRHMTAGTLQSVTKLASSVARNLDRLTLDEEHLRRTEEQRRQRPQGVTEGFIQGMTSFGISLLSAVGGIAHHPLQSMMNSGASPRSLVAGVGLGLVGVFTKPLSGAAELVSLTGQGLLQGAGWNSLPDPRCVPQVYHIQHANNSTVKYCWKFPQALCTQLLSVTDATSLDSAGKLLILSLILTTDHFVVINMEIDEIVKLIPLSEVNYIPNPDKTTLTLKRVPPKVVKEIERVEDELAISMDPEMRARVADYVRSTVGLLSPHDEHSDICMSPLSSPTLEDKDSTDAIMNYYLSSQKIKYFVCILQLAKQQMDRNHFSVL